MARDAVESASRRISLLTLGAAVLAAGAAANAGVTEAKKKGKKCGQKEKQRCSNDAESCKASLVPTCQQVDPERCIALQACCDQCSANGFLTCVAALNQP
jgi:hypothetical protein